MFKLLSTTGEQSIDLQPGRVVVVGRAVTSDVPIYDPTISRRHAEVSLADGGVKVKDVGSSNGTFLNGARITEAIAAENDVITFGKVAFRVKEISAPVVRPQVVPSVSAEFTGAKPAGGTIVRQLPVSVSGGVPAIVTANPSGASHLKVTAKSLEELREKKLELLLEISKDLSKQQELDRLLDKIEKLTRDVMNVDRVSILLLEEGTGELVPRISKGGSASTRVPQSIARKVVEDRVAPDPKRAQRHVHAAYRNGPEGPRHPLRGQPHRHALLCRRRSQVPDRVRLARGGRDRELAALGADAARSAGALELPALLLAQHRAGDRAAAGRGPAPE